MMHVWTYEAHYYAFTNHMKWFDESCIVLPGDFFTGAAFDVCGALVGDYSNGERVASFYLSTTDISTLVHINHTLWQCVHLQHQLDCWALLKAKTAFT